MTFLRSTSVAVLVAALLGSTAASAADLIIETPAAPVVVDTSGDWEGFYLGLAAGAFWASSNPSGTPVPEEEFFDLETEGATASLYAGYNWQVGDSLVLGLEGEVSWLDLAFDADRGEDPWTYLTADWSAALSARAGFLVTPELLLYGKLGYSWTNFEAGSWRDGPTIEDGTIGAIQVGLGVETKLTENVVLRGEVAYNFASDDVSINYGGSEYVYTPDYGTAKVGISFKF